MSLSAKVGASSPPVSVNSIVLEEHQLTSDNIKLQLQPDLQQRRIVVWMLTPVGCFLPVGGCWAVEVEATQATESAVDPVIRAETRDLLLFGDRLLSQTQGAEQEDCQEW